MQSQYLLGIDGGGTHCRARLTDIQGKWLAECSAGPANIFTDYDEALGTALRLAEETLRKAALPAGALAHTVAVMGFAGANVASLRQRLRSWQPPFARYQAFSDVEIACIGAHRGAPGAVLIAGTGSQGVAWDGRAFHSIGGWGFALSDQGSGAQLGRSALRHALMAHEGLTPVTPFTQAVMAHFSHEAEKMLLWSQGAGPADWAAFSPQVFDYAARQDEAAVALVNNTAQEIAVLIRALAHRGQGRLSLMGGLAQPVTPWLPAAVRDKLTSAQGDALSGALQLAARCYREPHPAR
ncbi:N-acetylglucosamine kinase [Affinibrenneria salicis]|uniref:N-acetylglucosamine kinase n=1 Tax=Affinibrenneria salicis TaxID=2590031 RepID=A0A5J5FUQ2_9GAMM|nr:BadF/BadG/BcrA/BcrD ATPase family protein [Affinibrenneria salicis]KAA8997396.1 N-acetylglucosamine kinase [Affinibrenneria salicis]